MVMLMYLPDLLICFAIHRYLMLPMLYHAFTVLYLHALLWLHLYGRGY